MFDSISRKEWEAKPPSGNYSVMPSGVKGVKIHYTGGRVDPACLDNHNLCTKAVQAIQHMHMSGNGWLDIAYSFVVCPHGDTYVGRGLHRLPAANGPGFNSGHYAVLALVGNAGLVAPPESMLIGLCDTIDYIREEAGTGKEVRGHRDGYATDCPGAALYAWVRNGATRPGDRSNGWPGSLLSYPPVTSGSEALRWQTRMREHFGFTIVCDGDYGIESRTVCKTFQRNHGLPIDGIVGPTTWKEAFK